MKQYVSKFISIFKSIGVILGVLVLITQVTQAAFTDSVTISANVFKVGGVDLKILKNVAGPYNSSNYADAIAGISFANLYPGWTQRYPLKVANVGTLNLTLNSLAKYVSGNPQLGDYITITIRAWNDANLNGIPDGAEVTGPYGTTTLTKWQDTHFTNAGGQNPFGDLGQLYITDPIRGLIFDFAVSNTIPTSLQNQTLSLDFLVNGTTAGAPQP